jgi:cob(I)alamin adenosyltransferase
VSVYTRGGDGGVTSLADASRVSKAARRIGSCGDIDELNAVLGVLASEGLPVEAAERVRTVQNALFEVGAFVADPSGRRGLGPAVADPSWLEQWIDEMERDLEPLHSFILPVGNRAAALSHQARAVCRRAERSTVALNDEGGAVGGVVPFLNRLSDALFVLARWLNRRASIPDVPWRLAR